jgi:hypothetical protein
MKPVHVNFDAVQILEYTVILEAIEPQAHKFHPSFHSMVVNLKDKFIKAAVHQLTPDEVSVLTRNRHE